MRMMFMHGRREMAEMVALHHLLRRRHLVWRWIWIHGNGMVAREMVDEMAGDATIGARVMHRRCSGHGYGWGGARGDTVWNPPAPKAEESMKKFKGREVEKEKKTG